MSSLGFNAVLLDISDRLTEDEVSRLTFLVPDIHKRERETIRTGLKLFEVLKQRNKLSADRTETLSQLLDHIHRHDLTEKLSSYEARCESSGGEPEPAERAKLNAAFEVITENLGRNWRKLGRRLGLTEVKLESISKKHPTDLEETTLELLKEWRRSRGAEASTRELVEALRGCQQNLTADKVEDRLGGLH